MDRVIPNIDVSNSDEKKMNFFLFDGCQAPSSYTSFTPSYHTVSVGNVIRRKHPEKLVAINYINGPILILDSKEIVLK